MYEHLVDRVKGNVCDNTLRLTWEEAAGKKGYHVDVHVVGAIETWLKRPKEPTPEERAGMACNLINDLYAAPGNYLDRYKRVEEIVREQIEAAIDADRKERGS